jgi:predicted phage terminase large subunit-like protein
MHLEAVTDGRIKRLLICVPPGHMKSLTTCVFWPAWEWTKHPHIQVIVGSYAHDFSVRDHNKTSKLIRSPWYQSLFNNVDITMDNETKLELKSGGLRIATSVGGVGTGTRVHRSIYDDLVKANDEASKAMNKKALQFCRAMNTRGCDPATYSQVMIMQRLSVQDPAAWAIKNGWDILSIPFYYEGPSAPTSIGWVDPRAEIGEPLWPAHFPEDAMEDIKRTLLPHEFAAQFQQRPIVHGGNIIKSRWFVLYDIPPIIKYRIIYADTAAKTAEHNDYTVLEEWGFGDDGKIYLLDLIRDKWEMPDLEARVPAFWNKAKERDTCTFGELRKLKVEDASSGTGLIQKIRRDNRIPIEGIIRGSKDRYQRYCDGLGFIQSGYVCLPRNAHFLHDYLSEAEAYTAEDTHPHDDQLDPTFDAINEMLNQKGAVELWENMD